MDKNIHLNTLLNENNQLLDTDNVYRARELILKKAPRLMEIIETAKKLPVEEKHIYCLNEATILVKELNYPREWVKTLADGFEKGILVGMYAENLDVEFDHANKEILIRVNASTSMEDLETVWKKDVVPLQKLLRKQTHSPQKIIYRDFIFTFLKIYRKDKKFSKFIQVFLGKLDTIEALDSEKVLTDTTIKQGVYNTIKKLKL